MKKYQVVCVVSLFAVNFLLAQSSQNQRLYIKAKMADDDLSFSEKTNLATAYFESLGETETEEDKEFKHYYRRWSEYWQDRVIYNETYNGSIAQAKLVMGNSAFTFNRCTTSVNNANPWASIGPSANSSGLCNLGIITAVEMDLTNPNIIYAGSNTGGLFKTTNGGSTWVNITDNFNLANIGINHIAINPQNPNHIMVSTSSNAFGGGTGRGVIESSDGGATWNWTNTTGFNGILEPSFIVRFSKKMGSTVPVYAGVASGIWSKPQNQSIFNWNQDNMSSAVTMNSTHNLACSPPALNANIQKQFYDMESVVDIMQTETFFASTSSYPEAYSSYLLKKTSNGWVPVNLPSTAQNPWHFIGIDETPADPGALYVFYLNRTAFCNSTNDKYVLAKTYDAGNTWQIVAQEPYTGDYYGPHFEMSDQNTTDFLTNTTEVFRCSVTSQGGIAFTQAFGYWTTANTHCDIRSMDVKTIGNIQNVLIGCDGGVLKSTDFGVTWTCINGSGLNISQFYSLSSANKSGKIVASPQDNWVKVKQSGSNTWNVEQTQGGESCWSEIDYTNDNVMYYSDWSDIKKSTDGGVTSTYMNNPTPLALGMRFFICPTDKNQIWANNGSKLVKYTGSSWVTMHNPTATEGQVGMAVAPTNGNVMVTIHAVPDWNSYNGNYAPSKKLYITTNGGAQWTDITNNAGFPFKVLQATHVIFDPLNARRIFISFGSYCTAFQNPTIGAWRVIKSEDQGQTWTDISTGLPPFCVNSLSYQNGTDDVIYAATDAGVYRWNKGGGTWECFNSGLPPVAVRRVDINYCTKKLYAATYGRGAYGCDLPATPPFHISTTLANLISNPGTTLPNPTLTLPAYYNKSFANDVIVDQNVTLKMNGLMSFAPNVAFIASKKSQVIITGTMTSYCSALWKGIQVGGDQLNSQNFSNGVPLHQGIVYINNGTISNAKIGVLTGTIGTNNVVDPWSAGGIVSSSHATYKNNKKDVDFLQYTFPQRSIFNKCTFITDQALLGNVVPDGHVRMNWTNDVRFFGCTFKYSAGNVYSINQRGYGIYATNAKFTVNRYCLVGLNFSCTWFNSKFENLTNGIYASTTSLQKSTYIRWSDFVDCYTDAVNLKNVYFLDFSNNTVQMGGTTANSATGVYLNGCRDYVVQNNTITASSQANRNGIIANQSSGGAHLIYRNKIDNCFVGINAQNVNSVQGNGLRIRCNNLGSNNTNRYDVAMTGQNPVVATMQGNTPQNSTQAKMLIGNRYHANCSPDKRWHIDPSGVVPIYHPNNNAWNTIVTPLSTCSSPLILPHSFNYPYSDNQCPDETIITLNLNTDIGGHKGRVAAATQNYVASIDGGNTSSVLGQINANAPGLLQTLQNMSPYLSDAALSAYFSKPMTPVMNVISIHALNAPVTETVWDAIESRQFTQEDMLTLTNQQNANGISGRKFLEMEIEDSNFGLMQAYGNKARHFLFDTVDASDDTLLAIIQNSNFHDKICREVSMLVSKENPGITAGTIDVMHGGPQNADQNCQFQKTCLQLNSGSGWNALIDNNVLKSTLQSIANNDNNTAQVMAQAPLEYVFGDVFPQPYLIPVELLPRGTKKEDESIAEIVEQISENEFIHIYPNPVRDVLNVTVSGNDLTKQYTFVISNLLGQVVYRDIIHQNTLEKIDMKLLPYGVYNAVLLDNQTVIKELKVVLIE